MGYALPARFQRSAAHDYLAAIGWTDSEQESVDSPVQLPPQVDCAYQLLLGGSTEIEIRLAIQEQYGKSARPTRAFKAALGLIVAEQRENAIHLPELVSAWRQKAIQGALRSGAWGAAATLIGQAGAVAGENSPERGLGDAGAALTISIEGIQHDDHSRPVLGQGEASGS